MSVLHIALFISLCHFSAASQEPYATYEPQTEVTDAGAIAFDQTALEALLGFPSEESFDAAGQVYLEGGNSESYAEITLDDFLTVDIIKGASITGRRSNNDPISGIAFKNYTAGDTVIRIEYIIGNDQGNHVMCRVGGLPTAEQELTGCFTETGDNQENPFVTSEDVVDEAGKLIPLYYTYNVQGNNDNGRTLKRLSTSANRRFRPNEDTTEDYFPILDQFISYYGFYDYGDRIVRAGLEGGKTDLKRSNVDLAGYGFEARQQIAKKGTVFINVLNYVIRSLYVAADTCRVNCASEGCNEEESIHALDEAVAFYVGNEKAADVDDMGNLVYALAEKRCRNFATCDGSNPTEGLSMVNKQVFVEFETMRENLNAGNCADAEEQVERIAHLFWIPLIQGTLRYAYQTDNTPSPTESQQAEGAIFAAAILPVVHSCNTTAANTIYDNMKLNAGTTKANFPAVKAAFESTYFCLHISCRDVGGLVDGSLYIDGAEPCAGVDALTSSASVMTMISLVWILPLLSMFL